MTTFAAEFEDFFHEWATYVGLIDKKTAFNPEDFLKEPEALAALMAIYDDLSIPLDLRQEAERLLCDKGVTVLPQPDRPVKFLVPAENGLVGIDSSVDNRRTREELAALPDLFTLSPANGRFAKGEQPFLGTSPGWIRLGLAGILLLLTVLVLRDSIWWLSTIIVVVCIIIAYRAAKAILLQRSFVKHGRFLQGQLITYTGRWIRRVETFVPASVYRISVTYVVRFPDGARRFGGNHVNLWSDQWYKPGVPGMPIVVLYHPGLHEVKFL